MKILYLVARVPFPINKGDKLRAFWQLNSLMKFHSVTLFAINDATDNKVIEEKIAAISNKLLIQPLSKVSIIINLFRGLFNKIPFQVSYFYSNRVKKRILKEIRLNPPDLIICQLIRMAEYVKDIKDIPKIIDYVDAISFGLKGRVSKENFLMRIILNNEYERVLKYEQELSNKFDAQLITTERDYNKINIHDKKKLHIVPISIDSEYFISQFAPFKKEYDLLFVGNMEYPPNEDAALFIINEILPLLKLKFSSIKLCIAGSSPSKKLLKFNSSEVIITGWVDDIKVLYQQSKIFIAPMRLGSGVQIKLLQALAIGIPSITTNLSFQGLFSEAKDTILVAERPEEFVTAITKLLVDTNLYDSLSEKGKMFAKKHYSIEKVESEFFKVINSVRKKL
jgi:glycosyltransferase involved in cell wall biosynthesis